LGIASDPLVPPHKVANIWIRVIAGHLNEAVQRGIKAQLDQDLRDPIEAFVVANRKQRLHRSRNPFLERRPWTAPNTVSNNEDEVGRAVYESHEELRQEARAHVRLAQHQIEESRQRGLTDQLTPKDRVRVRRGTKRSAGLEHRVGAISELLPRDLTVRRRVRWSAHLRSYPMGCRLSPWYMATAPANDIDPVRASV